ncbi:DUF3050 domain-containing protein [Pedobacter namyangjuensis]|uniref:DUF3050 domain-containing protein n=1 Tax=Pedobacter namyangjuensis TaxID=600626 RepID=UPI000DE23EC2|nr:DUF3050 domain-containing protein [Pedobacter namyangjuensis]
MQSLDKIQAAILPLKEDIINHKVYNVITEIADLRVFMEYHIYAVWDFMSLLKALQINLTCTSIPWFPVGDGKTRALINEIVAGEESDVDANGLQKSHFEMYLDAMEQCGADVKGINTFVSTLKETGDFDLAYQKANTPTAAINFVNYSFEIINSKKPHLQASAFTFGREDLIPSMFNTIVNDFNQKFPSQVSLFKYYLDRHIEVDGDHHSHLALDMTATLCQNKETYLLEAQHTAVEALQQRVALWDGAYEQIVANKLASNTNV